MKRSKCAMLVSQLCCVVMLFVSTGLWLGCNQPMDSAKSTAGMDIPSPDLPGAPKIPKLAVLRPYCETKWGNIDAGSGVATACVAKLDDQTTVVLSVLSFLSKANGLSGDVQAGQLTDIVNGITLGSAFGEIDSVIVADKAINIEASEAGDLLAIGLTSAAAGRLGSFQLAPELPAEGSPVWMSAALYGGAPASQRQHSAVVSGVDEQGLLTYKFDNPALSFEGTAGAPILNEQGQIVAIHCVGTRDGDKLIGKGNPTGKWLPHLQAAMNQSRP